MTEQAQHGGAALAGFWRRALAAAIDVVLAAVLLVAAEAAYLAARGGTWRVDPSDPGQPIVLGSVLLVVVLADLLLTWRIGGTLGKRAVGITVESRDGGPPGLGQLIGRLFGRVVSAVPALLGFLWAAWDRRKQTWHDKLADTVVVRDGTPVARPVLPGSSQDVAAGDDDVHDDEATPPESPPLPAEPPPPDPRSEPQPAWRPEPEPEPQPPWQPQPSQQPEPQPPWQPQPQQQPQPPQQPDPPPTWQPQPQPNWQPHAQPAPAPQAGQWPASAAPPLPPGGLTPPPPMPSRNDPNTVAIGRAGLGQDAAAWLQQVAGQVDARLDRVSPTWRTSPHAEAARACAFGLLLGHLARLYPHMRPELNATAELHPSFSTLLEGSRLATLEQIVAEPGRMAAWLGPLIDVTEPERMRPLLD